MSAVTYNYYVKLNLKLRSKFWIIFPLSRVSVLSNLCVQNWLRISFYSD